MQPNKLKLILPLYIPFVFSYLLINNPVMSYFVAWLGSFFIFYLTTFSPVAFFNKDLPIYKQVMRPIFLTQYIFAGFMCVTSIFYFLDHLGYRYLTELNYGAQFKENDQTLLIASCQRLCLLAHAALATGIILAIKPEIQKIKYEENFKGNDFLVWLGVIVFIIGSICQRISGLVQIALPLTIIGVACAAVLFVRGVITKHIPFIVIGSSIFAANFVHASLSGFKEPIITNVIILGCVFLPYFKKAILYLALPVCYILLYFLPTYNNTVRQSWNSDISAEDAQNQAFEVIANEDNKNAIEDTNWGFLTERASEINMFTQFVDFVPKHHDYYGWSIFEDAMFAIIPRIFWPEKPNIEVVSMERVYDAGVANRMSNVSAKTRPVVDAYLSWGIAGVFFFMVFYGLLVQFLCNKSEELFGGYELGCVIIFNSIFQGLWRGNNFEFMFNNIFYGFVIMWTLFWLLKTIKVLKPVY